VIDAAPHPVSTPPPPVPGTRINDPFTSIAAAGGPPTTPPPMRPPKQPPIRPNLYRPLLLSAIVAVAFAIGTVGAPLRSLGWAIAFTTLSLAVVVTSARRASAVALGIVATGFVPWLAVRMSPWLIAVDLIVWALLLIMSISLPAAGSLRVAARHHLARILRSAVHVPLGPAHLTSALTGSARSTGLGSKLRTWAPSVLIGVAALAGGLALLASGDALLASFLDTGQAPQTIIPRLLAATFGLVMFALLIGAVAPPGANDSLAPARAPAPLPALCAIVGLATAIAAYAATQTSAAILGADFVKRRTGLTYAEYARGGFFQLVAVSAVATIAVVTARSVIGRHPDTAKRFRIASAVLTVGVVVTVVSSVVKLLVYADTFGLTMLRLYTVIFACWLGFVSAASFVALLRPSREWLAPMLIGSVVVGAFAMNIVDPERVVAEHNISRSQSSGKLDVEYLRSLSLDAAPTILGRLDDIDAVVSNADDLRSSESSTTDARIAMRDIWCARVVDEDRSGLSSNLARLDAWQEGRSVCG
jgi:Domain of unknown function (DUF4173)